MHGIKVESFKAPSKGLETESDILNPRTATISSNLRIQRGATIVSAVTSVLDANPLYINLYVTKLKRYLFSARSVWNLVLI